MKVIVFGGTGTIGRAVVHELSSRHEIITIGKNSGDFQCDIRDKNHILELFKKIGEFDALISTTGNVHFNTITSFCRKAASSLQS